MPQNDWLGSTGGSSSETRAGLMSHMRGFAPLHLLESLAATGHWEEANVYPTSHELPRPLRIAGADL